jgi:YHS domain-containing protein
MQPDAPKFQPKAVQLVSTTVSLEKQSDSEVPSVDNLEPPAIEGYCPVALQSTGGWVSGNREFAIRHRGRIYWLHSAEAVQQFMTAPDKFSPILSGYDPMIFLQEGKLVEGSVQHGLHDSVSGGVFFFSSAESKKAFEAEPERNARALTYVLREAMK